MAKAIDYSEFKEVYPMDLGSFMLYSQEGYRIPLNQAQEIFNNPHWKTYYIDGKGRFLVADNRTGKTMELKIKQFQETS
jgi:hypothetical protein